METPASVVSNFTLYIITADEDINRSTIDDSVFNLPSFVLTTSPVWFLMKVLYQKMVLLLVFFINAGIPVHSPPGSRPIDAPRFTFSRRIYAYSNIYNACIPKSNSTQGFFFFLISTQSFCPKLCLNVHK